MSNKSAKIAAMVVEYEGRSRPARYVGYFDCFNRGLYYEAHDVLEDLWLAGGKAAPNYSFFKGLIQLAGAFVHLQKNRLQPAVALFKLAEANLGKYPTEHEGLDIAYCLVLAADWRTAIDSTVPATNPLGKRSAPKLVVMD
ncbi:MAG TPA: DUF309 domain-containing protein [Candidatus Limnocylindria bacterium]|nr:DUF309 domain-containing protein [Candidatus Limnocylindria bacterium]